jgi:pimeloyl-ACP methyl ester carboxylesterase
VAALAGAGWRVVAPDLLGYGGSDKPSDVKLYALGRQAAMMEELMVEHLGHQQVRCCSAQLSCLRGTSASC